MKTLLAILGAAALVAALMGTNFAGINPGTSEGSIDATLGSGFVKSARLVNDGTPRVAVKFDDARNGITGQVQSFLRRGIPVTLAINAKTVTDESNGTTTGQRLTWQEIRDLMEYAGAVGAQLDIANHTYSGWAADAPWSMGYDDYLKELQADTIQAHLGVRPTMFVYPGDPKSFAWMVRQRDMISSTLDSMGYDFAITGGTADSVGFRTFVPQLIPLDAYTAGTRSPSSVIVRPGLTKDPFWIHAGVQDLDLGNTVTERDGTEGYGTDSWLLRDKGANSEDNWGKTWVWTYAYKLANGGGFFVTIHDSVDTYTGVAALGDNNWITGVTAANAAGAFSPDHVAGTLKALHDGGFIKLVSGREWCEWVLSDYAPGTDLVANPTTSIPQFAIGDSSGVEIGWIAGWGSTRHNDATWNPAGGSSVGWDAGSNGNSGKYDRAQDHPDADTGLNHDGFLGRPGALSPPASQDTYFMQGMLPAGRYRLVFPTKIQSSNNIREFHAAAFQTLHNPMALWGGQTGVSQAYTDTLVDYQWRDVDLATPANASMLTQWVANAIEFTLPDSPLWNATELGSSLERFGGIAEQPGLFYRMWQDNWTWAISVSFQSSSPNQLYGPVQLRYLGPN